MTAAARELHAEVEATVIKAVEKIGEGGTIDRSAIVKAFMGRGTSRSSLFSWVDQILASGRPGQHLARTVKAAAASRAERVPDPDQAAAEVVAEAVELLPVRVSVDDIAGVLPSPGSPGSVPTPGRVPVMAVLGKVIERAELVALHAMGADGKVRMPKLLLQAGEASRRASETALRVAQAMHEIDKLEQFHAELLGVLETVARRHGGEIGQELLAGMQRVSDRWAESTGGSSGARGGA